MKAVATALVLIAGAAVVLWYGNTLNSWVLGGLIGGLAALLLSIPISLTLFSYLSRRHDERLRAEAQEEMTLAQLYEYAEGSALPEEVHRQVETYAVDSGAMVWDEDPQQLYPPATTMNQLPAPRQVSEVGRLAPNAQVGYGPTPKLTKNLPVVRGKDGRRTTKRLGVPGGTGSTARTALGQYQSDALRTARLEAAQQYTREDVIEGPPTSASRRPLRTRQLPSERSASPQATRQLPQAPLNPPYRQPSRRVVDSSPSQSEQSARYTENQYIEPETEQFEDHYPQTGSIRYQTGQMTRHPHLGEGQPADPEALGGSAKKPLQRRAPYMYDDDPLRQRLSQQIDADGPIVRRSSRFEHLPDEDEE